MIVEPEETNAIRVSMENTINAELSQRHCPYCNHKLSLDLFISNNKDGSQTMDIKIMKEKD